MVRHSVTTGEPPGLTLKKKVGVVSLVTAKLGGESAIVTIGGTVSMKNSNEEDPTSVFESVPRACTMCRPSASGATVKGETQGEKEPASTAHSVMTGGTPPLTVKKKVGVESLV